MGARYVWAAIALAAGLNAQAAKALDTSGDNAIAAPTENIRRSPDNAVYRNNRGLAYLQKDDYDRAIADFNEAIRLWPMKSAAAFNNRAMAFSGKGQHDRAIADFNRSIQIDPQNAWTYNSRGTAFKAKGDARRALADYSEAIRLSPRYVIAYQNRAAVLLSMGERSRALADLTRGRAPAAGASEQPILPQGTAGGRGWGFHQSVIGGASDSILSARS
uniref:tetratricopeptide repeat protein n=1 Tax=Methylobacterium nigriterrae TaxID=3127512 RepID=UPI00301328B7